MLASEVLTTAPIVLYPVELAVELRIEQKDVAGILDHLLQARTRASKVILCRQDCSCTAFAALQTLWIRNTFCLPTSPGYQSGSEDKALCQWPLAPT